MYNPIYNQYTTHWWSDFFCVVDDWVYHIPQPTHGGSTRPGDAVVAWVVVRKASEKHAVCTWREKSVDGGGYSYGHLPVITGYFYGIIHSISMGFS